MSNIIGNSIGSGNNLPLFSRYVNRLNKLLVNTESGQKSNFTSAINFLRSVESPSFVFIPNGRLFGTLYNAVPNNSTSDLTFNGLGAKTRINSGGYVEQVKRNLFLNTEDATKSNWGTYGVIISANTMTAPNGLLSMDKIIAPNNASTYRGIFQNTNVVGLNTTFVYSGYFSAGEYVKLHFGDQSAGRFNVSYNLSTGAIISSAGGGYISSTITSIGNNIYRISIKASTNGTTNHVTPIVSGYPNSGATLNEFGVQYIGDNISGIYLWGQQLEITDTLSVYQPATTNVNVPRINYSGSSVSLLLEPASTNLLKYSEDNTQSNWTKTNSTAVSNQITGPDNLLSGDYISLNTPSIANLSQTITTVNGTVYSYSGYIKNLSGGTINIGMNQTAIPYTGNFTTYNLSGSSWNYFSGSFTASDTSSDFSINNMLPSTYGATAFYLYGLQVESLPFPTSYIKTTTATATRVGESISKTNIYTNNFITSAGGTWFIDLSNNFVRGIVGTYQYGLRLNDTGTNSGNGFSIASSNNTRLKIWKYSNGSILYATTTDSVKIAINWDGSVANIFVNGVKVVSNSAFTATQLNYLDLVSNIENIYNINKMCFYPTPLSDDKCITLTT